MLWNKKQKEKAEAAPRGGPKFAAAAATADVILEAMNDGVAIADANSNFIQCNTGFVKMFGFKSMNEVIGISIMKVVAEQDIPKIMTAFEKSFKTGNTINLDFIGKDRSGREFPVILNSTLLKDEKGNVVGNIGVIRDITELKKLYVDIAELKKAEKALQESSGKLQNLVETLNDWIWEVDAQGRYTYVSPQVRNILGYEPGEVIGKTPFDLMSAEEAKRVAAIFGALAAEQKPISNLENTNLHKDGRPVILETSGIPFYSAEKKFMGYRGVDRNITERKQAEEMLRASEVRYRSYIDVTGQIGWITSADGVADDMPEWRKYTGQSKEEVKGWGWLNAIHPDDRERTTEVWNKAVATKSTYETEYRIRRKDGAYKHFLARGIPSLREDGTIREWVGTCIDITEMKQAQEKIKIFSKAVESAYDSFVLADINGNVTYANESAIKTFGYSPEEILKLNVFQFTADPKDAEKIVEEIKNKGKWSGEVVSIRKSKETFPVLMSNSIIKDDKGNPAGMMGVFRDLTERKQAEEEKHRMEERSLKVVEDIFRFIPEGVLVFSRKIELLRQNQAFRELISGYAKHLGFAEDELENLIIDKVKAGLRDNNIKEIRIARKHETGKQA